jgi:hypothetical protein
MNKLVLDHSYALGLAWDKTPFRNHGVVYKAPPGGGYNSGSFSFAQGRAAPGAMVVVPPSNSLDQLGAVRVRVLFSLAPAAAARRHNLVEGHRSFALFVNANRSIQGSFLAPDDTWLGIRSAPDIVQPGQWQWAEFWYDGVGEAEILINDVRVAHGYRAALPLKAFNYPLRIDLARLYDLTRHLHLFWLLRPLAGPVRGVGPLGLFVGHWAETDDRFTLDGHIRRVQVYKQDDLEDLMKLIDPCCMPSMEELHDIVKTLVAGGLDPEEALKNLNDLKAVAAAFVGNLAAQREDLSTELKRLTDQLLFAIRDRGRSVPIEPPLRRLIAFMLEHATREQIEGLPPQVTPILDRLGIDPATIDKLAGRMCFSSVKERLEKEAGRIADDPAWRDRFDKFGGEK